MSDAIQTKDQADAQESAKTTDGYTNFLSRYGVNPTFGQNQLSEGFYSFNEITRNRIQLEAAYRGSWIVGQVVDCIAEDMTREGIDITSADAADNIVKLQNAFEHLRIWQSIRKGIKLGRLYGGAIGVLQIEGQDLQSPLNFDSVGKGQFKGITVYDRWQLNPNLFQLIQEGPNLGLPAYYDIVLGNQTDALSNASNNLTVMGNPLSRDITKTGQITVHHSRVIRFIGIELPYFQAITEMLWGESIIERLWDRLIPFDNVTMAAANLVNRAQLRTVSIEDLRKIIAGGGSALEGLHAHFDMMRKMQSNEGLTLLDKKDIFTTDAYSFSGLSDIMIQMGQQLAGASRTPMVRLFGQSPAGMNSTGESDMRQYYDYIKSEQNAVLRDPVMKVLKVLYRSLFAQPLPDDLQFDFIPLWQMDPIDKANIAKTKADTIAVGQTCGVSAATTLQELKSLSGDYGIFSNIEEEDIETAKTEEPPMPDMADPNDPKSKQEGTGEGGAAATTPPAKINEEAKPAKSNDSFFSKIFGR